MFVYSIIIPHRNIPKLLQRCLDSIPQRPDLEIIVVDDNSDPEIVDFEHFPGQVRSDTTVIFDKSGLGPGHARNIGLEHAQGKWLFFADADDYFNYCLNDILDEYADCKVDIVYFKCSSADSELYTNSDRADYHNHSVQQYLDKSDQGELFLRYVNGGPVSKLIRRSIVVEHKLSFQEIRIHEDTKFFYLLGLYAKSIAADKRAIYCITKRPDSISYTMTPEKILDRAMVFAEREVFYHNNNLPFRELELCFDDLIMLLENRNRQLYDKCLDVFASFGFSNEYIEKNIAEELKRRKTFLRKRCIVRYLRKLEKLLGKVL